MVFHIKLVNQRLCNGLCLPVVTKKMVAWMNISDLLATHVNASPFFQQALLMLFGASTRSVEWCVGETWSHQSGNEGWDRILSLGSTFVMQHPVFRSCRCSFFPTLF